MTNFYKKTRAIFVQNPVRDVCAKFKVDRLSRFRTGARKMFTTQKPYLSEIFSNYENCNITFSDQITVYQIYFEIYAFYTSNKSK